MCVCVSYVGGWLGGCVCEHVYVWVCICGERYVCMTHPHLTPPFKTPIQVQARTLLTHVLTTNNPTTAARPLVAALLRDAGHARREAWALFCRFVGVEWEGEREGLEGEGGFETDGEEGEGEGSEGWMARAVGAGAGEGEEEVVMDVDGEEEEGDEGGKAKKGKGGKSKGKSHKGKKSRRGGEGVRVEVEIAPTIRKRFKQHLGRQGQRVKKAVGGRFGVSVCMVGWLMGGTYIRDTCAFTHQSTYIPTYASSNQSQRDAVVEEALACLGTLLALTTRPPSSSSAKQPQQPQQHTFTKRGQVSDALMIDRHIFVLICVCMCVCIPLSPFQLNKPNPKTKPQNKNRSAPSSTATRRRCCRPSSSARRWRPSAWCVPYHFISMYVCMYTYVCVFV